MLFITLAVYTVQFFLFLIFPKLTDSYLNFILAITPIYIVYGILVFLIIKAKKTPVFLVVLVFTLIALVFLPKPSILSNDIYRYFWDGGLINSKINPYDFIPQDSVLSGFHNTKLYELLDWKYLFSPYPPLAEFLFSVSGNLYTGLGLWGGKIIFAIPMLVLSAFIYKYTDKKLAVIFLLNPLVISEVVYSGHIDGWAILFLFLALFYYIKSKFPLAFLFATLGFLTKVYPAIIIPFFVVDLIRKRDFRNIAFGILIFVAVAFVFWYPFVKDSLSPIVHYFTLPDEQEFNASIYRWSYQLLGSDSPETKVIAKYVGLGFFCLSYLYLLLKPLSLNLLSVSFLFLFLGSSVVFPWYTLVFIPFIFLEVARTKNYKLLVPLICMQFAVTWMYFEPGKRNLRDLMLNIEYVLLLIWVIYFYITIKNKF